MPWAPDYATTAELREYVTRDGSTVDDTFLALALTAGSRAVDRACNRQFGSVTPVQARKYSAVWDRRRCRWVISVDDLMDATGLTVAVEAGTITPTVLQPVNAPQTGKPWTRLVVDPDATVRPTGLEEDEVTVTALWGWTAVPNTIKQATLLQASRIIKRRDAPFGVAGSPEMGSELRLLAKVDPDVEVAVRPYVRWWSAA